MADRRVFVLLACSASALLIGESVLSAFQGMTAASRVNRPTAKIETNLPPIKVDFRDIAEESGLSAVNVSGSVSRKKYILETTGSGIGIFDYDNDGLMDIFVVNGTSFDAQNGRP